MKKLITFTTGHTPFLQPWLSDMCGLEKIVTAFEDDANLAWGQNKKVDSFQLVTMCVFFFFYDLRIYVTDLR